MDMKGYPQVNPILRWSDLCVNTFNIISITHFMIWMFLAFLTGKQHLMIWIYSVSIPLALGATYMALASNGLQKRNLSALTVYIQLSSGVLLLGQQIVIWIDSIIVLGFVTCLKLLNGWHCLMAVIIIWSFISAVILWKTSIVLSKRDEWIKANGVYLKPKSDGEGCSAPECRSAS